MPIYIRRCSTLTDLQFVNNSGDGAEDLRLPGLGNIPAVVPQNGVQQGWKEVLTNLKHTFSHTHVCKYTIYIFKECLLLYIYVPVKRMLAV